MRKCSHCGVNIEGKRANARYCSTSCRVMGNRRTVVSLPIEMTSVRRWVTWKPVKRGDGYGKVPLQLNGAHASPTHELTWTTFDNVRGLDRKGFVLGNGVGCVDLDKCLVGGVLADWASEIIAELEEEALLIEVSPSGEGIHIFLPLSEGRGQKIRDGRNIEVYPPDSGRFICVTGKTFAR